MAVASRPGDHHACVVADSRHPPEEHAMSKVVALMSMSLDGYVTLFLAVR